MDKTASQDLLKPTTGQGYFVAATLLSSIAGSIWVATLGCYTGLLDSIWVAAHNWLIHPTHSGRSGCKDSFLLTGPFYSAILLSILLCSSRLHFTLRVHFTLSLSFSSTFHIAGPFYFALLHWGRPTAGWILRLAQSVGVG